MGCTLPFCDLPGFAEFAVQSAQPSASDEEASDLRWKSTQSISVSLESDQSTNLISLWLGALPGSMPNNSNKPREVFPE
jgi:hypothetical protein